MGIKVTVDEIMNFFLPSAINKLNANETKLANEFDKVVYRDGSLDMDGALDMNSNRIFNLPKPVSPTEPIRYDQITTIVNETIGDAVDEAIEAVQEAINDEVLSSQAAALTSTQQAVIAVNAASSVGNAKALTGAIGFTSDVVQTGADIVATQVHRLNESDNFDWLAPSGHSLFPVGARVYGSWNATHRGLVPPIPGAPGELYEVEIPAGTEIGNNNSIIYFGIITPTAPLPLTNNASVTFTNPRVVGAINLTDRAAQTLGKITWRGAPAYFLPGDLLVYWGQNTKFIFGGNVGISPPTNNAYDGNYHIVYEIPGPNNENALGSGFTATAVGGTGAFPRQFPYIAKTGAGTSRALIGLPNSPAFLDATGKLPTSVMPTIGNNGIWVNQAAGFMGTSIETDTGGVPGQVGWVPKTIASLGAIGTVGGVGSSLFCFIGDQGGGGDKLSFSATPSELSAIGGDPANSFQSKCYNKGFKLLVIGGGVINDANRNVDDSGLCAVGTPSDTSPNTIWGAFNRVIPGIQANSPNCQIIIEGMQHSIQSRGGSITSPAARSTYNEALRAIAKAYKLPFLDFLNMSGVTLSNYTTRIADQGGAWIHPAQIQQDQMARQATAFLNGL